MEGRSVSVQQILESQLDADTKRDALVELGVLDFANTFRPKEELKLLDPRMEEAEQRLRKRVNKHKLKENSDIDEEGDCQFDAISDQLNITGVVKGSTNEIVRRELCDWIKDNAASFVLGENGDSLEKWIKDTQGKSVEDYVTRMRKPKEWGDDVTLLAAVQKYSVMLRVWNSTEAQKYIREFRPVGKGDFVILFLFVFT